MNHVWTVTKTIAAEKLGLRRSLILPDKSQRSISSYVGKHLLRCDETNEYIAKRIKSGEPFMVGRYGATELFATSTFDFNISQKKDDAINQLNKWSGFFPKDKMLGDRFAKCIIDASKQVELLGVWGLRFEDYYIRHYMSADARITFLFNLEPWKNPMNPWSAALEGKKVLVIHPFAETIQSQYQKRQEIFPGTDILPRFELKTLKAVQTVAGEKDERFATWFDALEWMYQEAIKIDFDIAIIGCGAYGFPLAAKLKQAGKQAVHLGGATQLMFGIKGKRWEEDYNGYEYIRKWFNDAWGYPSEQDKPQNADTVEGGCYW